MLGTGYPSQPGWLIMLSCTSTRLSDNVIRLFSSSTLIFTQIRMQGYNADVCQSAFWPSESFFTYIASYLSSVSEMWMKATSCSLLCWRIINWTYYTDYYAACLLMLVPSLSLSVSTVLVTITGWLLSRRPNVSSSVLHYLSVYLLSLTGQDIMKVLHWSYQKCSDSLYWDQQEES